MEVVTTMSVIMALKDSYIYAMPPYSDYNGSIHDC